MATSRKSAGSSPGRVITRQAVEQHVGDRSFRLGRSYVSSNALFQCQRQGDLFKARCQGQSADHYLLRFRLVDGRILDADCNCPVGDGGHCKHVAAALITVLETPQAFIETEFLAKRLSRCEKPQLVELMARMIEEHAELEDWLDLALPAATSSRASVVKSDVYYKKIIAAFSKAGYGWEADRQLTATIDSVRKIGDQFLAQGHAASAAAVYRGILEAFDEAYETFHDETGDVFAPIQGSITSLGKCFSQLSPGSDDRQLALRAIFDVLRFDIDFGGLGFSDDIPELLSTLPTPEERKVVVDWIREELTDLGDDSGDWSRRSWGGLLLDVDHNLREPEAFLRHCREFDLQGLLIEKLLQMGRTDEAIQEVQSSTDYELMGHADRLVAHQLADQALSMVRERCANEASVNNWQLREWLQRFYRAREDWPSLLSHCLEDFRQKPAIATYRAVREHAGKLKKWKTLRPELIAAFPTASADLVHAYLDEDDVAQAVQAFELFRKRRPANSWGRDPIEMEMAKAAEKTHPDTALEIYREEVNRLIDLRGRDSYRQACEYLKKIAGLLKGNQRADEWRMLMETLRNRHRTLRALQQEMVLAGL